MIASPRQSNLSSRVLVGCPRAVRRKSIHWCLYDMNSKLVDLAVEAIGKEETLNLAVKLVRRNGTLLAFGLPHKYNYDFAFHDFFWNEGQLICSLGPTVDDFRVAVDLISNGVIDVAPLLTHTFPLSRAQEAFTLFADHTDGVVKVTLTAEE